MSRTEFATILDAKSSAARAAHVAALLQTSKEDDRGAVRSIAHAVLDARYDVDLGRFSRSHSPESVGDGWWLCPACAEAFEESDGVWQCPKCQQDIGQKALHLSFGGGGSLWVQAPVAKHRIFPAFSYLRVERDMDRHEWWADGPGAAARGPDGMVVTRQVEDGLVQRILEVLGLAREADEASPGTLPPVTAADLWRTFPPTLEHGYLRSEALEELASSLTSVESLVLLVELLCATCSFVPGGDWVPDWMPDANERQPASPLDVLIPALEQLQKLDRAAYLRAAASCLPFVLCDSDVLHHDARAASAELGRELVDALTRAELDQLRAIPRPLLIAAIDRAARTLAGFEYGADMFALVVRALQVSDSPDERTALLVAAQCFHGDAEDCYVPSYLEAGLVSAEALRDYAERIPSLVPDNPAARELGALLREAAESPGSE
jgi:hypothetical protein